SSPRLHSPVRTHNPNHPIATPTSSLDLAPQQDNATAAFSVAFELLSELAFVVQRNKLAKTGNQLFTASMGSIASLDSSLRGLNATISDLWQGKLLLTQDMLFHFPKAHHIQDLRDTAAISNRNTHISFAKLLRVNTLA